MKQFTLLLGLISFSACKPASPQESSGGPSDPSVAQAAPVPPAGALSNEYRFSGPFTHENMTLFLIHKPGGCRNSVTYVTLEEALQAKTLLVTEKSGGAQVNRIEVENVGDQPVYLQAGDAVKGGQQDRTIGIDVVLPPQSGKREIDAFCVEPSRWRGRQMVGAGGEGGNAQLAMRFEAAPAPVATKEQKLAVKLERNQGKVWEEGKKANEELAAKTVSPDVAKPMPKDSYVLTTEEPAIVKKTSEFTSALGRLVEGKEDVVGLAFAVNGEMSTVEIYSEPGLFRKLWPKLLKGAALEAIAKKTDKPEAKKATVEELRALMAQASDGKSSKRDLAGNVSMETVDGIRSAMFDTRIKGELLHRQVLTK